MVQYFDFHFVVSVLAFYVIASRMAIRFMRGSQRDFLFGLVNVVSVYLLYFFDAKDPFDIPRIFLLYLFIVFFCFIFLKYSLSGNYAKPIYAFFLPILFLVFFRYISPPLFQAVTDLTGKKLPPSPALIGLSYMAFRLSRLVLEVRNGGIQIPSMTQYLGFAFFLPTLSIGPINTYENHRLGFESRRDVPVGRALMRILVGLIKFQFLCALLAQLDYTGLMRNGHLHSWEHLAVAAVSYYLYLYCNFSGFCDIAIGTAALIGVPVTENFNNPFAARNIKDFWNRWHITLSAYMRDVVFAPLSKFLVRLMGPSKANHAIAIAITVVFLLVGIWHGVGWHYAIFGLVHAFGLVVNHYYTIGLKKWLGNEGFKKYNRNRLIHVTAVILTFAYCAASMLFFSNTLPQIKALFTTLV